MAMENAATITRPSGVPVAQLKSLVNQLVTVSTEDGEVTGVVLSCTRLSVWMVGADDADVVVAVGGITGFTHHTSAAA